MSPTRCGHQCSFPGCKIIVRGKGYCKDHDLLMKKKYDLEREDARDRGYDTTWRAARRIKLISEPLCEKCLLQGVTRPATLVHHIDKNPHNNDIDNLMSLCNDCHRDIHKHDVFKKK